MTMPHPLEELPVESLGIVGLIAISADARAETQGVRTARETGVILKLEMMSTVEGISDTIAAGDKGIGDIDFGKIVARGLSPIPIVLKARLILGAGIKYRGLCDHQVLRVP